MNKDFIRYFRRRKLQIFALAFSCFLMVFAFLLGEDKGLILTGVVSSFSGALAAFSLSALKEVGDEKHDQAREINKILLKLVLAYDDVLNLKRNTLDRYGTSYGLVVECPPMPRPDFDKYRVEFSAISFLTEEHPNMMLRFGRCEQCLKMLEVSVSERNHAFQEIFHPKALEKGLLGRHTTKQQFRTELSEYIMNTMEAATDAFETMLLAAIEDLEESIDALNKCGREMLPSYQFIAIDRNNEKHREEA